MQAWEGKGEGHLRRGVREPHAPRRQRIQVGRLGFSGMVAAQVVGASGVKSDKQNVGVAGLEAGLFRRGGGKR